MKILTPSTLDWEKQVAETLRNGKLILYPTDTTYGIGVDATNTHAIEKVFEIKHREQKPISIVVRDLTQAEVYAEISEMAKALMGAFLPGALTIVVPANESLPDNLKAGKTTIGIRIPNSPITKAISLAFEHPFTATSANLSGKPAAYSVQEAMQQLDENLIDLIIDLGALPDNPTSTVLDCSVQPPIVLREGGISSNELMSSIGK